jgi:alpha-amylase
MTTDHQPPVYLTFGLHAHQPVGNFGHVFEEHLERVYEPFLERAEKAGFLPLTLHLSGPLLDWMEEQRPAFLDRVGRLAADGKMELLLGGYYEPVLPSLPREDRLDQILWMREALRNRFGIEARGLWLAERVWEPDLAADLGEAGVGYVLVDDRHFVAAGFPRESLFSPFRTESGGRSLGVFAIDEQLRYLIPFRPPEDTVSYLRGLRSAGQRLAVAADDIEKFGGWPGTHEWVYERGWLDRFMEAMKELEEAGEIRIATLGQALADLPSAGPAYLPSASYREMEEWALPTQGFRHLEELKEQLGEERFTLGEAPLIRGSHWRNFLVKYTESNRMHKKMMAVSRLCRERGDPPRARRHVGRAQCNDAYWHGVFGGLYLRHLREAVWENLARAEGLLREGEELAWEEGDLDLDGEPEIWVHSHAFSAIVSPVRGGRLEELTLFGAGVNLANTLTRRREPYHELVAGGEGGDGTGEETNGVAGGDGREGEEESGRNSGGGGTPSIHDLEEELRFREPPPVDREERALFVDRIVPGDVTLEDYAAGRYQALATWARTPMDLEEGELTQEALTLAFTAPGPGSLHKRMRFLEDGTVEVRYRWDTEVHPPTAFFATELSLAGDARVETEPDAEVWRHPISTFSKSERGFDETVQGESLTVRWTVEQGEGIVRLVPG